jgi:hypothetical protein
MSSISPAATFAAPNSASHSATDVAIRVWGKKVTQYVTRRPGKTIGQIASDMLIFDCDYIALIEELVARGTLRFDTSRGYATVRVA